MLHPENTRVWVTVAVVAALALFLSTFQTIINGSQSAYTTDVGEIQNALPRWGTIHWTGYPLYSLLGSLFVTLLQWLGVSPAAGTSLFSSLWGILSVGFLVALLRELDVSGPLAALGALVVAGSTSFWMDASLAEVHTMTSAFILGTLLFALRFGRSGRRGDFLLLAFFSSQGVIHQRAVLFLAPAVLVLICREWHTALRNLLPALGIALLAPLTYLYLPWRVSQGATWTFGTPGTWQQTMAMLLDNRAERIVSLPEGIAGWWTQMSIAMGITVADLTLPLAVLGLVGLLAPLLERRWRDSLGLTLAWIPYLLLTSSIWIGRIGDAQLAAQLPVTVLAAAGLALLGSQLARLKPWGWALASALLAAAVLYLIVANRPLVLEVTRDPAAEATIAIAEQVAPPPFDQPTTFMALWGNDYWALAYAQPYQGRLPGLNIVDHNANFDTVLDEGRLLTFHRTFYQRPYSWWEQRLGRIYLSSAAPRVVEIGREPPVSAAYIPPGPELDLENGLWIRSAQLEWKDDETLVLVIFWQAETSTPLDYSIAVHLIAQDPPTGPEDILDQSDRSHPVYGLYPTSLWEEGEVVRTYHLIHVPEGNQPQAVRIAMYRLNAGSEFVNTPWLTLPLPGEQSAIQLSTLGQLGSAL
jgi:hypothetical protein